MAPREATEAPRRGRPLRTVLLRGVFVRRGLIREPPIRKMRSRIVTIKRGRVGL